jgi:hypothetical protein
LTDTAITPLVESEWTAIGTAPAMIAAYAGDMVVVLAAAQPAAGASSGFTIRCTASPLAITQTGAMWPMGLTAASTACVQV